MTALVWQFPVAIAGTAGHSVGAAIGAAVTMVAFMTLFSIFGGVLAIGLVGAGAGYLVRHFGLDRRKLPVSLLVVRRRWWLLSQMYS
ncbi:hypothetical protein GS575_23675 [Rhodococcus hoagii]|nr:hypothetical protein [Prescottella equi]